MRQGQLVATIRDDDYRAKVASAEAALATAQSAVNVLSGQAALQSQKIDAAAAEVRAAEAGLKQTRLQHARQRALIDDGTATGKRLRSRTWSRIVQQSVESEQGTTGLLAQSPTRVQREIESRGPDHGRSRAWVPPPDSL
jgi:membrane fusion protein (multidrug efflux system)